MTGRDGNSRAAIVPNPPILYGTAWKQERTQPLVERAIELGFRGVDTAAQPKHYDEAAVGRAIAALIARGVVARDALYVQTKFTPYPGQDPLRVPYDPKAPLAAQVAQSFASSLENLQTDYVDSLVLHSPMRDAESLAEVWTAMEAIAEEGAARQLGISNCYSLAYLEHLWSTAKIKPAVVQNRFYAATGYDVDVRSFCAEHGMVYQSFWTLTANAELLASPELLRPAARLGRTPAQILFRYLAHEGVVPLTGTQSEAHMREDLAIFEFELRADERDAIAGRLGDKNRV
ncbi:MAG TPA: aldo/keto reductase [Gammaproteobacteria bacterium]